MPLDQVESEVSEKEDSSDTGEVAKIGTHMLGEKEDAHMYTNYERGDHMHIDEREDVGGKSATQLQLEDTTTKATFMGVEVLSQTEEERTLASTSKCSRSILPKTKESRPLPKERRTILEERRNLNRDQGENGNLQPTQREEQTTRGKLSASSEETKNQHYDERRGSHRIKRSGPASTGGDPRTCGPPVVCGLSGPRRPHTCPGYSH